jgi:hypothetical protein
MLSSEALAGAFFMYLFPKITQGGALRRWTLAWRCGRLIACFGMATETGIIMLVYSAGHRETAG